MPAVQFATLETENMAVGRPLEEDSGVGAEITRTQLIYIIRRERRKGCKNNISKLRFLRFELYDINCTVPKLPDAVLSTEGTTFYNQLTFRRSHRSLCGGSR